MSFDLEKKLEKILSKTNNFNKSIENFKHSTIKKENKKPSFNNLNFNHIIIIKNIQEKVQNKTKTKYMKDLMILHYQRLIQKCENKIKKYVEQLEQEKLALKEINFLHVKNKKCLEEKKIEIEENIEILKYAKNEENLIKSELERKLISYLF